jgi:hypothetical protein
MQKCKMNLILRIVGKLGLKLDAMVWMWFVLQGLKRWRLGPQCGSVEVVEGPPTGRSLGILSLERTDVVLMGCWLVLIRAETLASCLIM